MSTDSDDFNRPRSRAIALVVATSALGVAIAIAVTLRRAPAADEGAPPVAHVEAAPAMAAPAAVPLPPPAPPPAPAPPPLPEPAFDDNLTRPDVRLPKATSRKPRPNKVRAAVSNTGFLEAIERSVATGPLVARKQIVAPLPQATHSERNDDDVKSVLRDRAASFQSCYERALKSDPALEGSVDVEFTINREGGVRVQRVAAKKAEAKELVRCVRGVLQRAVFAESEREATVSTTLTFRPRGA